MITRYSRHKDSFYSAFFFINSASLFILVVLVFFSIGCSKNNTISHNNTVAINYDGVYIGDMIQNGPTGIVNYPLNGINFKVNGNKLERGLDSKIVRIDLSGSDFNIIPDTTQIGTEITRIITGNGSFNNNELILEMNEKQIFSQTRIENINLKGKLKR